MSEKRFATRPCPPAAGKSRYALRREELQKQEQLLLQKKKEVEAKLYSRDTGAPSSATSSVAPAPQSPQPAVLPVKECASTPITNKFQNNGSFLSLFRSMQQEHDKEPDHSEDGTFSEQASNAPQATESVCEEKESKLEAIEQCATFVAMNGPGSETVLRERFNRTEDYKWLFDSTSMDYKYFEHRIRELRSAKVEAEERSGGLRAEEAGPGKKRKSRWGSASDVLPLDADLVQYAMQVFGTVELEESQWRQLQDQRNMRMLTGMARKRMKHDAPAVQYEYDSDEDVDGGTWEHKRRMDEMEKTRERAQCLTQVNEGKTHVGDYLPPDELSRFLRQWERIRSGKAAGSMAHDYEQFKLTSENAGFKMLQRMGWKDGQSLGADARPGISEPITIESTSEHRGLGASAPGQLREGDDEFDAYRKRMMFAYRFRPNPLVSRFNFEYD